MKKQLVFIYFLMGLMAFSVEVVEKNYDFKDTKTIVRGNIPIFKYGSDIISTEAVNRFEALSEVIVMESNRYFVEEKKENPSSFILKSEYSEKKNESGIKSYVVKTYYYIGGDHGMIVETPYNFLDGKEITLKDIFKEGVSYNTLIKNKLEEIIIEEDPSMYYENIILKEKGFKFYFSEDKLIILFNTYEIGPYESGIPSFSIPISELKDYLKIEF